MILARGRAPTACLVLVILAGAVAAFLMFPRERRLDRDGDWRAVTQGMRRSATEGALVAPRGSVVHFHHVRGGILAVEMLVSARAPASLAVARDGAALFEVPVDTVPRRIVVPVGTAPTDIDVALDVRGNVDRVQLHEIRLRRGEAGGWLRVLPAFAGLLVLLALGRDGGWVAGLLAVGAVALVAVALTAAVDPVALLALRPGPRASIQAAGVAALFAVGVACAERRLVGALVLGGTVLALYAPTVRYGLVYDDFLWTRPWTAGEVASTFVGSEDPTGVSNSYYRPLASTSHALDYLLWGFRPPLYHLSNMVLLTLAGLLAWSLFRRLPVSAPAALAGALVWAAHPMSASAVSWISQRTDILLAIFYLATLRALLARPFGRAQQALTLVLGLLTFATKELALTLPVLGALLLLALPREEDPDRPRRFRAVRGLLLIVLAYAPLWIAMFPEKFVARTGAASGWGGFDPHAASDWLRLLPALYGPLLLPTGYGPWWRTPLHEWSGLYLLSVAAVTAALAVFVSRDSDRSVRRLGAFALVWPLIVVAPLLGLRGIDLYRGGLFLALAAGWLTVAVMQRLRDGHRLLSAVAAALIALALTPLTTATAAAWGPGGFYRGMTQASNREMTGWLASLQPHCRDYFWKQVREDEHRAGEE